MKERLRIWLVGVVALLFIPGLSVACSGKNMAMNGNEGMHSCCHPEMQAGKTVDKSANHVHKKTASSSSEDEDVNCCGEHGRAGQSAADKHSSKTPCSDRCCHGCHCTLTGAVQVLLAQRSVISLPSFYKQQVKPALLIIRLPSGFDFIWRPPKIG